MRRIALIVVLLGLAGCPFDRFIRANPVPAQCDAVCYVTDAKDDADTACASRTVWTGDRNDPKEWDNLVYGVIPQLRKETWTCGVRLKACQQCIERLVKAKVITKP